MTEMADRIQDLREDIACALLEPGVDADKADAIDAAFVTLLKRVRDADL